MTDPGGRVLRIERTFDAPIESVFEAWTSEEVLGRWLHADPDWDTPVAEVDLRVGGTVRIVMRGPEADQRGARGEYTVVDAPHRLAFTWVWDDDPENPQMIELEFSERDGATTVVMFNSGIPTDQVRDDQEAGWHRCYDNLERALAKPSS
jgi:uncharacterized protein YndB with AHSA1/START domain